MVSPLCRPGVTLTVHPIADPLFGLDQDLLQPAVQGIDGGLVQWDGGLVQWDGPLRPPLSMLPWEAQMVRWRKRLAAAAVLLSVLALTGTLLATQSASAAGPRYLDPKAPVSVRVKDLLRRMTLEEKVGQMDQIVLGKLRAPSPPADGDCNGGNNDPLQPVCLQKVLIDEHTGSILSGGTDNPTDNTGRGWAVQYNTIQRYAIEHSRLHIPIIYGVDAVHGFGHPFEATLFPQSIGMGATWDLALARAAGAATRRQLLATGGNWNFAPVQDLARDNRWGRYYETWAEAPVLAAAIGAANVRGLQGGGFDAPKVAATVKHFAGYSESINGHDRVEAQLSLRYLQDTFFPSYAGGIDAGAATVMVNSGSVNGVPATASRFLLTDELRGRLGFKGVVISDYGDVRSLQTAYHIAADYPEAVAKAVNARRRRGDGAGRPGWLERRPAPGRAHRGRVQGPGQRGRDAHPYPEVQARAVRPPLRRSRQGGCSGQGQP
jgi:beta-glucosidase